MKTCHKIQRELLLLTDATVAAWGTWPHSTAKSVARGLAANSFIVGRIAFILLIHRELFNYLFSWDFYDLGDFHCTVTQRGNARAKSAKRIKNAKWGRERGRGQHRNYFRSQVTAQERALMAPIQSDSLRVATSDWRLATKPCKGACTYDDCIRFPKKQTKGTKSIGFRIWPGLNKYEKFVDVICTLTEDWWVSLISRVCFSFILPCLLCPRIFHISLILRGFD